MLAASEGQLVEWDGTFFLDHVSVLCDERLRESGHLGDLAELPPVPDPDAGFLEVLDVADEGLLTFLWVMDSGPVAARRLPVGRQGPSPCSEGPQHGSAYSGEGPSQTGLTARKPSTEPHKTQ